MSRVEHYRACAARGLCEAETARECGVSREAVRQAKVRHGIVFTQTRSDRMKAVRALSVLSALTPAERANYDLLKRKMAMPRAEALRAIGRGDLA